MKKSNQLFYTLLTVTFIGSTFVGCKDADKEQLRAALAERERQEKDVPSKDDVFMACSTVAERTRGENLGPGGGLNWVDLGAVVKVKSVEVTGTSRNGVMARVEAIATVEYLPVMKKAVVVEGGFTGWMSNAPGTSSIVRGEYIQKMKPGQEARYKITLDFRRYDKGWKLESFN